MRRPVELDANQKPFGNPSHAFSEGQLSFHGSCLGFAAVSNYGALLGESFSNQFRFSSLNYNDRKVYFMGGATSLLRSQ